MSQCVLVYGSAGAGQLWKLCLWKAFGMSGNVWPAGVKRSIPTRNKKQFSGDVLSCSDLGAQFLGHVKHNWQGMNCAVLGSCLLISMGLEKAWFMQEFPFRLIPTLPALPRGLQWVCSEDVCSFLWPFPLGTPCWAGNCSQPIPFLKAPVRSYGEYSDFTHINPPEAPESSREQRKTEEIFPLLSYALLFFFFFSHLQAEKDYIEHS